MYICCICQKPLEALFKWEELCLPPLDEEEEETDEEDDYDGNSDEIEILLTHENNHFDTLEESNSFESTSENVNNSEEAIQRRNGQSNISNALSKWRDLDDDLKDTRSRPTNWSSIVSSPCGHLFHLGCIHVWMENLERRGCEPTCAYCRQVIDNSVGLSPVYPVVKDTDSDSDCPQTIVRPSTHETVPFTREDEDVILLDLQSWLPAVFVTVTLLLYNQYIVFLLESANEDHDEDDLVLFGNTWTISILSCTTFSIVSGWISGITRNGLMN